jgi:leucyl aminopeptidase (aminopeptidase T)
VTEALAAMVVAAGARPVVVRDLAREIGGQEPSQPLAAALLHSQVAILQSKYALVHTNAFRAAFEAGVRMVELWGVTDEMMVAGGLIGDFDEIERVTQSLATLLKDARTATFTTPSGTSLNVKVAGRPVVDLGAAQVRAGTFTSLPGGEVAISPVEGSAEGVLVDPFVLERVELGYRKEPLRIEIQGGKATRITGGREAVALEALLERMGETARNIAEFAIGTNAWCRPYVSLREAKKTLGTAHVALGDNKSLGGQVDSPMHMDMIFERPTVRFDDRLVMDDGKLVLPS